MVQDLGRRMALASYANLVPGLCIRCYAHVGTERCVWYYHPTRILVLSGAYAGTRQRVSVVAYGRAATLHLEQ
eukprot:402963-Rhodomonas_salina.1